MLAQKTQTAQPFGIKEKTEINNTKIEQKKDDQKGEKKEVSNLDKPQEPSKGLFSGSQGSLFGNSKPTLGNPPSPFAITPTGGSAFTQPPKESLQPKTNVETQNAKDNVLPPKELPEKTNKKDEKK